MLRRIMIALVSLAVGLAMVALLSRGEPPAPDEQRVRPAAQVQDPLPTDLPTDLSSLVPTGALPTGGLPVGQPSLPATQEQDQGTQSQSQGFGSQQQQPGQQQGQ